MNKKSLLALPLSVLAFACAPQGPDMINDCRTVDIPKKCQNINANPQITIHTNVHAGQVVTPPHVCINDDKTITFNLAPGPKAGTTYAVIPKNPKNTWMIKTNTIAEPKKIIMPVPKDTTQGDYDYLVVGADGFCVDPRVHVN